MDTLKLFIPYLKIYLESSLFLNQLKENISGTAQQNINATNLSEVLLPIPPLAEQKRIAAKVAEFMEASDKLGEALKD